MGFENTGTREGGTLSDRRAPGLARVRRGRTVRLGFEPSRGGRLGVARENVERVLQASARLREPDRVLIEAVFGEGRSVASVARLTGARDRLLRRRVRALVERIQSPMFAFVSARAAEWEVEQRRAAVAFFVEGRTIRETAREIRISFHRTREHLLRTRMMLDAAERAARDVALRGDAA